MTVSHLFDFDGLADSGLIQLLLKHLVPEGILLLVIKKAFYNFFRENGMLTSKRCSPPLTEKENNARDNRPRKATNFISDLWVCQLKEAGEGVGEGGMLG
jgi:hypothetical protein